MWVAAWISVVNFVVRRVYPTQTKKKNHLVAAKQDMAGAPEENWDTEDEAFEFEPTRSLIAPDGGVWLLKKSTAGFVERQLGERQQMTKKSEHAKLAWEAVELALTDAFKSHRNAMKELKDAFQLWDAFNNSFGEAGRALTGDWPEKIETFHVGNRAEVRAVEEKRAADAEKKREKEREAKAEEERQRKKKEEEEARRKKEEEARRARLEKARQAREAELAEKAEKARLEKEDARRRLQRAQGEFQQAHENAMLILKEQEKEKKKERAREYRPYPTCLKCGEPFVSRHWKCPNVDLHYLVDGSKKPSA